MRRNKQNKDDIEPKDDEEEILYATLYSLHSYMVHGDDELYRIRTNENVAGRFAKNIINCKKFK